MITIDPLVTLIVAGAILVTAWMNQRIGGVKIIRFPATGKPPAETKEIAVLPPTRWALLIGWLRQAARITLTIAGLLFAAGWLLGGCR